MVALGRKYDTGIFLSPTKETCFLYLYTCYLDEDYVPRYARNFVLYKIAYAIGLRPIATRSTKWHIHINIGNMNIGKAYRSAQLCDLIGQHELSAEQQDVCETQMPLSTAKKVQIAGLFFKISHDLSRNFRAGAFVKKLYIQEMGLDGPVLLTEWELLANISTRK